MPQHRPAKNRRALIGLGLALSPWPIAAQTNDIPPPLGDNSLAKILCEAAGYHCTARDEAYLAEATGSVVFALLSYVGVIFVALMVYGGFRWMLARGNEQEVERGKAIIRSAIIGLIITLASYSIWLAIAYFI